MTRILLVEDEPLFRKGLAKMIAGSGTSWNVCGEAENGQEAEQLIAELHPDLVITDIRMPLMDGLELLKRAKAASPDIEFIVITGFQDFQYAQTALRHGALDLLVKPCSKQDIDTVLEKVEVIVQEKQKRLRKQASERQLQLENTLRSIFLRSPYSIESVTQLEHSLFGSRLILFQITDYFPAHRQYSKRDVPLLQFAVLNIISELLDVHDMSGTLLLVEPGRYALFITQGSEEQSLCTEVCATVMQLLGLTVTTYQGGLIQSLLQLADLYESIMTHADVASGGSMEDLFPLNRAQLLLVSAQMMAFILGGQTNNLKEYLEQLMKEICTMQGDSWKIDALSLSFALQDTARKQFESEHDPQVLTQRISRLHECRSTDEAYVWMKAETDGFLHTYHQWQSKHSANAISKAIRYMKEHFSEPLSLQQVASQVHLNTTYFSHLFKKETGCSFVNFLIELRMERAKQLLSNTDMNVTEVSGMIGYDLPNYFAKLFKQSTGLSPKEFRKLSQI
ncbi:MULTISPECIES: response regulator transcription factor [unclassified Paenibacillus]|uniref:response regulator transcription factor n=1 Tax=unclassified Paenibacillus TaxID=185978 RepID=UPI00362D80FF